MQVSIMRKIQGCAPMLKKFIRLVSKWVKRQGIPCPLSIALIYSINAPYSDEIGPTLFGQPLPDTLAWLKLVS
jgi:hypothetical protein